MASYILYDMSLRLNARIDDRLARKIECLRRNLSLSTTDVVRRSIECLYEAELGSSLRPASIIEASGLVGCGEAESDLSETYKGLLTDSLGSKH